MRNGTPGFCPDRLIEARGARGLTQVALAELTGRTSSSISRWEAGDQSPEPEALQGLSRALNLPMSFFLRSTPEHGDAPMFARSMASTTQSVRRRVYARLRWAQEISLTLQEFLDLPEVSVPRIDVADYREIRPDDIERMALECRRAWGLGMGPVADLVLVLENAGICVVKEQVDSASMDGLSNWSSADGRPYILIAKDKQTCARSRLDAAHELGHLVLHGSLKGRTLLDAAAFKEIERQAFAFAGAFLLPAESFGAEVWSPSLNSFVALKERWKTSIGAMIMRCSALDMISEEYQQRLWKHYSARGWRKSEPLDDVLAPEEPRLLARCVRLLIEEKVLSRLELLEQLRIPASDVEAICGLPRGYFSDENAEILQHPRLKSQQSESKAPSTGGNVIPFGRR